MKILACLCILDLSLSFLVLTPFDEANPIVRYIWLNFGFVMVATFKLITFGIGVYALYLIRKHNHKIYNRLIIFLNGCLLFTISFLLLLVIGQYQECIPIVKDVGLSRKVVKNVIGYASREDGKLCIQKTLWKNNH